MIFNTFVAWFRIQRRQAGYTLLNMLGLTLGLSAVILITLYIHYEFSYDRQHTKADRIYQVVKENTHGTGYMGYKKFAVTPAPLAPALMDEFPEVEAAARLEGESQILIQSGDRSFVENGWVWADSYIFDIFTIPLVQGMEGRVLSDPWSVVISESAARKYFGEDDPMGRTLVYENKHTFHVTGVMKDIPANSTVRGDFLAPFKTLALMDRNLQNWSNSSYHTFFLLQEGADPASLEAKYADFLAPRMSQFSWWKPETADRLLNEKLTDIHLRSDATFNFSSVSDIRYIAILSAIAAFILLIASMNYMNLATARSVRRAREVGVRKAIGAQRYQLILQFLGEALLLVLISLILALVLARILLPVANTLLERTIPASWIWQPQFLALLLAMGLVVAFISGSYPAFSISRYKPVHALRPSGASSRGGSMFRSILVLIQFAVSVTLIISTLVVSRQMHFIQNTKLGFTKERIVVTRLRDPSIRERIDTVKRELLTIPGVKGVSVSSSLPMRVSSNTTLYTNSGDDAEPEGISTYVAYVDEEFIPLYEMELLQGRLFSAERDQEARPLIINETTARRLGWDDISGRFLGRKGDERAVVGMVRDFHYTDMHLPMEPVALMYQPRFNRWGHLSVKIKGRDIPGTLKALESVWSRFSSGYPFDFRFADEVYDSMYRDEIRLGRSFRYFSILAIVICCLGLFGLASYSTEQRAREISIRKVLGGSVPRIMLMLLRQFTQWVLIANLLAWPVAWLLMRRWLQDFAFRTDLTLVPFLISGLTALAIAVFTVGSRAVKVSLASPVTALRQE